MSRIAVIPLFVGLLLSVVVNVRYLPGGRQVVISIAPESPPEQTAKKADADEESVADQAVDED